MRELLQQKTTDMLRWSEKYTKTDMVYMARGSFWLILSQGVTVLFGLVLAIAFANLLPKEMYGVYRFVLSVTGVFTLTTLSGLNTALSRAVVKGDPAAFMPIFKERVRFGLLGGAAALIAALYYYTQGNMVLAGAFGIAALFLPFSDPLNVYEAYRNGLKDFRYNALADIVIRIGTVTSMLVALLVFKSVVALVCIYFASYTLLQLIFFLHTKRSASRAEHKPFDLASILGLGKHLSAVYIIGSFATQIDKLVIFHFTGAAALAAYAFAIAIPDQLRAIVNNITVLAYPKFVMRPLPEVLRGMATKNLVLGIATAGMVALYIVLTPLLFHLFFPHYPESILITQLLALTLVDVLTLLPLSALKAHGMTKSLYHYYLVSGVVQVGFIALGGFSYGLFGVIAGLVGARVFAVIYLTILMQRLRYSHSSQT